MSPELLNIFYQSHIGSWAITILLFILSYFLIEKKAGKILHMILRLFYIIMIVSGVGMLIGPYEGLSLILKGVLALWLIYFMEMILVRTKKGKLDSKQKTYYWIQWVVTLLLVVVIGFGVLRF
ncbi:YisL family protein [Bacillus sp. FJAT-45350]|uniref:YisL family protein n=1 Tax=Bacillus sp. FJAT-45350 TaxID=2011014 RepID=UPI000BB77A59|nr:YisL family protein [Bacillus sp. FJAT-45350]